MYKKYKILNPVTLAHMSAEYAPLNERPGCNCKISNKNTKIQNARRQNASAWRKEGAGYIISRQATVPQLHHQSSDSWEEKKDVLT